MVNKITLLPISIVCLFIVTFIITYIISVKIDHVSPFFPYISDTGTYPPESCFFGQMLNIGALLTLLNVYIRYRQIEHLRDSYNFSPKIEILNKLGLWLGVMMSLGASLVGNFQETSVLSIHLIGANMAFGVGSLWGFVQTIISYMTTPLTCSKLVCHIRLACSFFSFVLFLTTMATAGISISQYQGSNRFKWESNDKNYEIHLVSTLCEWMTAFIFGGFFLTLMKEFQHIQIEKPLIKYQIDNETLCKRFQKANF